MAKPQPHAPAEARLPSILELGKLLAAAERAVMRFDEEHLAASPGLAARLASEAVELAQERESAIRGLIVTMPAQTLADAAVQLSIANLLASGISDSNEPQRNNALAKGIERITLGVLPIVAEAAGLDLVEMGFEQLLELRADRFRGVEGL